MQLLLSRGPITQSTEGIWLCDFEKVTLKKEIINYLNDFNLNVSGKANIQVEMYELNYESNSRTG
jgi:hypothetical protein